MKTLRLEIELTYDDDIMHGGNSDTVAKDWFINDVLGGELDLVDKIELGDDIGKVKVISITGEE
jgi:hypothetical protein